MICEERKKFESLMAKKERDLYKYQREVIELKDLVKESQEIVDQISASLAENEEENKQLGLALAEKEKAVRELQAEVNLLKQRKEEELKA